MREKDLFPGVRIFLEHFGLEVHGEVADIDAVGIGDTFDIAIEMKRTLSFELLDQVAKRVGRADYLFICIPKRKKPLPQSAAEFLRSHKVGVLEVDIKMVEWFLNLDDELKKDFTTLRGKGVSVTLWGGRHNVRRRRRLKHYTSDLTRKQVGGVTSEEVNTPYKQTIENIQEYMSRCRHRMYHEEVGLGWMTVDEILTGVETHYSRPKPSVTATLKEEWNKDWVEFTKHNRRLYFRYRKGTKK